MGKNIPVHFSNSTSKQFKYSMIPVWPAHLTEEKFWKSYHNAVFSLPEMQRKEAITGQVSHFESPLAWLICQDMIQNWKQLGGEIMAVTLQIPTEKYSPIHTVVVFFMMTHMQTNHWRRHYTQSK